MPSKRYAIRIHWGYWCSYDPHPFYHADHGWDGGVLIDEGRILESSLIRFEGLWGPQKETFIPLKRPIWHWQPRNNGERFGGVLLLVEGTSRTRLHFDTRSARFDFTVGDLIGSKVIRHHVGPRYGRANVTVLFDGHDPLLDQPEEIAAMTAADGRWRILLHARDMSGRVRRCYRTDWIWIAPGEHAEIAIDRPAWKPVPAGVEQFLRVTFRCGAMVPSEAGKAPDQILERETDHTSISYLVRLNDREVVNNQKDFGAIRGIVPLLEELVTELPESDLLCGTNLIQLCNVSDRDHLLLGLAFIEEWHATDPQITVCPRWVLLGKPFTLTLRCRSAHDSIRVTVPDGLRMLDEMPKSLAAGDHRFEFEANNSLAHAVIGFETETGTCEA